MICLATDPACAVLIQIVAFVPDFPAHDAFTSVPVVAFIPGPAAHSAFAAIPVMSGLVTVKADTAIPFVFSKQAFHLHNK